MQTGRMAFSSGFLARFARQFAPIPTILTAKIERTLLAKGDLASH
jgi:hypothetical protein